MCQILANGVSLGWDYLFDGTENAPLKCIYYYNPCIYSVLKCLDEPKAKNRLTEALNGFQGAPFTIFLYFLDLHVISVISTAITLNDGCAKSLEVN